MRPHSLTRLVVLMAALHVAACASRSLTPKIEEVKVSREAPGSDCKELGKITGTTSSVKASSEEALRDLKNEAALKGADYVTVKQYSDNQTMVTGIAYECH